jgi:hypothetical protein
MCVIYNYFSITLTKILNTIETVSTTIQESIFGQIKFFSFLNVENISVFDSNIKMQIYMFLVILVMNNINR